MSARQSEIVPTPEPGPAPAPRLMPLPEVESAEREAVATNLRKALAHAIDAHRSLTATLHALNFAAPRPSWQTGEAAQAILLMERLIAGLESEVGR